MTVVEEYGIYNYFPLYALKDLSRTYLFNTLLYQIVIIALRINNLRYNPEVANKKKP